MAKIVIAKKVLEANDNIAARIRDRFREGGISAIDIMGSPGSGKTSVIERTIERLKDEIGIAVIGGDLATSLDADRLAKYDIPVVQINTGTCHLTAYMIEQGLEELDLDGVGLLIIENVGNLICPAGFDLGQDRKVLISSVPEGDDKPLKHPLMMRICQAILINKMDLINFVDFDTDKFKRDALNINPEVQFFEVSARIGEGIEDWTNWLRKQMSKDEIKS